MGENNSYLLCRCDLKQQLQIFNVSDDSLRKGLRGLRYHFSYFKGRQLPLAEILCAFQHARRRYWIADCNQQET